MSTCKKKSSNPEEKKRTGAPRDGRKVKTNDLVSGVLVIVRLEGQHWLGLVLAQPESLQVEKEVREGNVDDDDCEDVDDEDDSFHAYNQMRRVVLAIWW